MQPADRSAFLAREARSLDPDRALCALFAPPSARDAIFGLVLLNWELARVPELVSQPMAGMIRYQWWRDGVEAAARGQVREQPVLRALAEPLARGQLHAAEVQELIDAREQELEPASFATLSDLEAHLAATSGKLQELWVGVTAGRERRWRDAARAAGVAFGLVGIARAVPWGAARGRLLLPMELLSEAGLTPAEVTRGVDRGRLAQPVGALTTRARMRIDEVRLAGQAPRAAISALLPAHVAKAQARRLAACGYDPTHPAGSLRPPLLPLVLASAWLRRRT